MVKFCVGSIGTAEVRLNPDIRIKGENVTKAMEALERQFEENERPQVRGKLFIEGQAKAADHLRLVRLLNRGNVVRIIRLAHRVRCTATRLQLELWIAEQLGVRVNSIKDIANWKMDRAGLHIDFTHCGTKIQMRTNRKILNRIADDAGCKFRSISIRKIP
jgi:hypothetical protein